MLACPRQWQITSILASGYFVYMSRARQPYTLGSGPGMRSDNMLNSLADNPIVTQNDLFYVQKPMPWILPTQ